MRTRFFEAVHSIEGGGNHGKFMVGQFDPEEWERACQVDVLAGLPSRSLLGRRWNPLSLLVVDLQTGEGAIFLPGGLASADLHQHQIWVCPLFEPFLAWLYEQDLRDLEALPSVIELPDAPGALYGHRRSGPSTEQC
jgi:hypothetical protein